MGSDNCSLDHTLTPECTEGTMSGLLEDEHYSMSQTETNVPCSSWGRNTRLNRSERIEEVNLY